MSYETLLQIDVIGTPRPKGSLRHIGRGRMVEQVADGPAWRGHVAWIAANAWHEGTPHAGPVAVRIALEMPRPKKPKNPWPISRATGDADKHARNILDALQDAGVLNDDSQVVDLAVCKRYTTGKIGARITVTKVQ